jgi:alkylated DNA repair protein (DNA oxidative demethylase)
MMLFDLPLLPGLRFREELLGGDEEAALISEIGRIDLSPFRFQGWTGKRMTRTYGWRYDFDDRSFQPVEEIPEWMGGLREKAARFAGLDAAQFVHALVTRYDHGAPIGWHRDRPNFGTVVGISLGSEAVLRFRKSEGSSFRRFSLTLPPRSAYMLSGEARHEWEHSIAPAERLRFSITFRTLSDKGLAAASRTP